MKIEKGSKVTLIYDLMVDGYDGEVWERIESDFPLQITVVTVEYLCFIHPPTYLYIYIGSLPFFQSIFL